MVSTYFLNPVRYRDFFWAWTCRLLVTIGGGNNYTALYIAAAVLGALGGLAVLPIRKVR